MDTYEISACCTGEGAAFGDPGSLDTGKRRNLPYGLRNKSENPIGAIDLLLRVQGECQNPVGLRIINRWTQIENRTDKHSGDGHESKGESNLKNNEDATRSTRALNR